MADTTTDSSLNTSENKMNDDFQKMVSNPIVRGSSFIKNNQFFSSDITTIAQNFLKELKTKTPESNIDNILDSLDMLPDFEENIEAQNIASESWEELPDLN